MLHSIFLFDPLEWIFVARLPRRFFWFFFLQFFLVGKGYNVCSACMFLTLVLATLCCEGWAILSLQLFAFDTCSLSVLFIYFFFWFSNAFVAGLHAQLKPLLLMTFFRFSNAYSSCCKFQDWRQESLSDSDVLLSPLRLRHSKGVHCPNAHVLAGWTSESWLQFRFGLAVTLQWVLSLACNTLGV
jgi:hypothetical protein